ncbi:MAG: pirin family protein, partial [Lutibacter sp.]|nr:pirin family protein [Lutibacter sp.]
MKKIIYKSANRGKANYGWLDANYSFSFANYYDPEKVNFGALRVLNNDTIQGGMGFGAHPHDNMEIITIPLTGALKHKDSMGNKWIAIEAGEVQVMSAGSGLQHSEMNNSPNEEIELFQIWIFPDKNGVEPRYDQQKFDASERKNKLQILVSSMDGDVKNSLKIHQDALISRID